MKKSKMKMGNIAPYAYITKSKQRVKQYVDTVYLQDGDEFEIELFNPTSNKILAKIEINGNIISNSGVVLRPGERIFLDRYLDDSKKFIFETYMVNNNSKEAIKNNGTLSVKFYDEQLPDYLFYDPTTTSPSFIPNYPYYPEYPSYPNEPIITCYSGNITDNSINTVQYSTTNSGNIKTRGNIETGRIEKGGESNQQFKYDSSFFNSWYNWQCTWKILPLSQKLVSSNEIKVYCVNCGSRRKKQSHIFCPNCGTKF